MDLQEVYQVRTRIESVCSHLGPLARQQLHCSLLRPVLVLPKWERLARVGYRMPQGSKWLHRCNSNNSSSSSQLELHSREQEVHSSNRNNSSSPRLLEVVQLQQELRGWNFHLRLCCQSIFATSPSSMQRNTVVSKSAPDILR